MAIRKYLGMDDSGGGSVPAAIKAPAAKLTYDAPAVQTYSPSTGYTAPASNRSYSNMYAPTQFKSAAPSNTPSFGIGTPTGGAYGGGGAPAPQAKPVMSESDWLAGDSEYQNQLGQFDGALQDFLGRLATQRTDFTNDYNTAVTGLGRNRGKAELGLGEDFTSRGLANSGLFAQAGKDMGQAFETQETGLKNAKTRAESDFTNQESDKRKSTEQAKGNSKLASLGRMSMSQQF